MIFNRIIIFNLIRFFFVLYFRTFSVKLLKENLEHKYVNTLYTLHTQTCTPLHVRSTGQPELEFDSKLKKVVIKKNNWYACFNVSRKEFPAYSFCRKCIPDDEIVNFILRNRYNRIYIL